MKGRTALVVTLIASALFVVSVLGGLGYYGLQRYRERAVMQQQEVEDLDRKALPDSKTDATQDLVDTDYQFKLLWPGKGFKILPEQEASKVGSAAIAGVIGDGGCALLVTAEHVPGGEIEAVARSIIEGIPVANKQTRSLERTTFQGHPAVDFQAQGDIQGLPYLIISKVVAREGWFFQFVTWRPLQTSSKCEIDAAQIVKLLDGPIKGRVAKASAKDEERPLFRVKDKRYEAPSQRLAIVTPEGTALLAGEEARSIDPEAGFILSAGSKSLVVSSLPLCGQSGPAYLEGIIGGLSQMTGPRTGNQHQVRVAGQDVTMVELSGPSPYVTLYGGLTFEDRLVLLRGVYPPELQEGAKKMIDQGALALELLSKADAERIQSELPTRDGTRMVRLGRSLRGGRYTDYEHGASAALPPDPSLPTLELAAALGGFSSPLIMHRYRHGVTSMLLHVDAPSKDVAQEQHALVAAILGVTTADITPKGPGRFGYQLLAGPSGRFDLRTYDHGGRRLYAGTWGVDGCVSAAETDSNAFLSGVKFANPRPEDVLTRTSIKNERFGFELTLPDGDWKYTPIQVPGAEAIARGYEAKRGKDSVGVLALHIDAAGRDPEFLTGFMEQVFAKKLADKNEVAKRSDGKLGRLPARILRYSDRFVAIIAQHGGTAFLMFVERAPLSSIDPNKLFADFAIAD